LPTFSASTLGEILKRDRVLTEKADQILRQVERLRDDVHGTTIVAEARFETRYRRTIARTLNRMELFGLNLSRASRSQPLNVAYVSLEINANYDYGKGGYDFIVKNADKVIGEHKRLVIRGPAGSGKTTLLKWIAVQVASRTFEDAANKWHNAVPFLIRLRDFREGKFPRPADFLGFWAAMIADSMPKNWVQRKLRAGDAVLMIDGVDEVADRYREHVREWIRNLTGEFPDCRIVVTSRPHAVDEPDSGPRWLETEGFCEADLQPMRTWQIEEFVRCWHLAAAEELQYKEDAAKLRDLATALTTTVRSNLVLRHLATNPLLCGVICALHHDTNRQLPEDRIQLYEQCCLMLLERRDLEREVGLEDYPRLTYRQKRALLEDLAYHMRLNGWSVISVSEAELRIRRKLKSMQNLPAGTSPDTTLRFFVDRSGMMRERSVGYLDFAHRAFQEYLSAKAAVDEGDFGVLRKNGTNTQWREVITLAAGLARSAERNRLRANLIADGDSTDDRAASLHLLAAACQQTAVDLSPSVRKKTSERLARYVPPKDVRQIDSVANAAGDLLVPFLKYRGDLELKLAGAYVRALALIGSAEAHAALAEYARDDREPIWQALVLALTDLNPVDYRTIAACSPISSLDLSRLSVRDLTPLAALRRLQSLDLSATDVTDLGPISGLTQLKSLRLRSCRVKDLAPLAGMGQLERLDASGSAVSDLTPITGLSRLRALDLGGTRVTGLTPVSGLTRLESLSLANCEVSDIAPLAGLSKLETLDLQHTQVSNVALLANLPKLREVSLYYTPASNQGKETLRLSLANVRTIRF